MPRRSYESTATRQEQIIDAARKVIIRYGSEHVTVKRIAKEVGISEAAVYRHFKSKREILSLLADNVEQNLVGDIVATIGEGYTPLESLDAVLKGHLSAVEQRRGVSFLVIAEIISLGDKKLNKKLAQAIDKYTGRLKTLLAEGVRHGEVREDLDLEAAAMALFGMIQGLINIWALNGHNFDPQEEYAALWSLFLEAIIKR